MPAKSGKFARTFFDHPLMVLGVPNEFASTSEDPDFELTQETFWLVTVEHWTGSPSKSIDQIGRNCPKTVRKLCFQPRQTIFGHFSDIFSTFFGHFVDIPFFWAVQRFARHNFWPYNFFVFSCPPPSRLSQSVFIRPCDLQVGMMFLTLKKGSEGRFVI